MTIYGFYYDCDSESWIFKDICNILFLSDKPFELYPFIFEDNDNWKQQNKKNVNFK